VGDQGETHRYYDKQDGKIFASMIMIMILAILQTPFWAVCFTIMSSKIIDVTWVCQKFHACPEHQQQETNNEKRFKHTISLPMNLWVFIPMLAGIRIDISFCGPVIKR
jgi:hypothetical protein